MSIQNSDPLYSGDNRPSCYYDNDGSLIIRASAIGGDCLWELIAAGQGYQPGPLPDALVRAFRKGHELEDEIRERTITEKGWVYESTQGEGHLLLVEGDTVVKVRFHSDGIAEIVSYQRPDNDPLFFHPIQERAIVEIKALGDDLWQKAVRGSVGDCFQEYNYQLSVMMLATGLPAIWVAYNKGKPEKEVDGIVQSELCPDKGKIHYEYVATPPISLDEIQSRVRAIKEGVGGQDILESGRPCDSPSHWPCLFQHLRPEVDNPQSEERSTVVLEGDDADTFDDLVARYVMYKGQADEADQLRKQALADIEAMVGKSKQTIITDKWVVPMVKGNNKKVNWGNVSAEAKAEVDAAKEDAPYHYLRDVKRRD